MRAIDRGRTQWTTTIAGTHRMHVERGRRAFV
jgi:hypothetical protein